MKKFFLALMLMPLLIVSMTATCRAGLNDDPTIAVLPFINKAPNVQGLMLGDGSAMSDVFIDLLLETGRFSNVIEREQILRVVNEQAYQSQTMTNSASCSAFSQMGAGYLVAGSLTGLGLKQGGIHHEGSLLGGGSTKFTVEATVAVRIIEVKTGRIVLSARSNGKSSSANAEFYLKIDKSSTDEYGNVLTNILEHKIKVGAEEVSNIQVINAVSKALENTMNDKNIGLLAKIDGSNKRRK